MGSVCCYVKCPMIPLLCGFAQQIGGKSENMQSAFATRQFVTSFCTILSNPLCREVIDNADCTRMFQIGDRRMPIAYSRTKFVQRDLLCKAAVVEVAQTPTPCCFAAVPLGKGGQSAC